MRKVTAEMDVEEGCIVLGFEKELYALVLGPPNEAASREELTHILFTGAIEKARKFLSSQGVNVCDTEQDAQGTRHFEMRDLEGNTIEISEEP